MTLDTRDTKRITITVNIPVTLTVDAAEGPNGAEVVSIKDVDLPEAEEVMAALDHEGRFAELDLRFKQA